MLVRLCTVLVALAASTAAASAQSYPGDSGAGTQRGIQQLNNSGQVGTVTLFGHGTRSRLRIEMHGTPNRAQAVRLYRGADCDSLAPTSAYILADLKGGLSRTDVGLTQDRLLSGNYNVVVLGTTTAGAAMTACGHLYA